MKKIIAVAAVMLLATACNRPQPPSAVAPAATPPAKAIEYKVVNMSPRSTPVATPFNVQVDNGSGISFELNHPAPPGQVQVIFDGKPLGGVAANGVIVTATIPNEYIAKAGRYPVTMQLAETEALPVGDFVVQ